MYQHGCSHLHNHGQGQGGAGRLAAAPSSHARRARGRRMRRRRPRTPREGTRAGPQTQRQALDRRRVPSHTRYVRARVALAPSDRCDGVSGMQPQSATHDRCRLQEKPGRRQQRLRQILMSPRARVRAGHGCMLLHHTCYCTLVHRYLRHSKTCLGTSILSLR